MEIDNSTVAKIVVMLLFAISFTLIGWTAPVIYASHAPQDQFIEVHNFEAQDAGTDAEQHYICFDRTVYQETSGIVYTELYLLEEDERIEVGGETVRRYFQDDTTEVITPLDLPPSLQEGKYRYVLVVEMQLADGRIQRQFAFESEPFRVDENYTDEPLEGSFHCD